MEKAAGRQAASRRSCGGSNLDKVCVGGSVFVEPLFSDRAAAGRLLGKEVRAHSRVANPIVLALPRGGVPVGFEVSLALNAVLDVFLVRKLGVPGHDELAMGAIASGGTRVLDQDLILELGIQEAAIDRVTEREEVEIVRRGRLYREDRPALVLQQRSIVVVDDGLATGATMRAALRALRMQNPAKIIVAVPVASRRAFEEIRKLVDEVICIATPDPFYAVGAWYQDFPQTSDAEVRELLDRATGERGAT